MIDSRIVATDSKWRLVRLEEGERVTHVLEKQDGFDALGCERWKEMNLGSGEGLSRQLRDWIIDHALRCPLMKAKAADEYRLSVPEQLPESVGPRG